MFTDIVENSASSVVAVAAKMSDMPPDELETVARLACVAYKIRCGGGYPTSILNPRAEMPINVVWTITARGGYTATESKDGSEYTVRRGGKIVAVFPGFMPGSHNLDEDAEPVVNHALTKFLEAAYPKLLSKTLQDGDIVRVEKAKNTYRNDGVFFVYNKKIIYPSPCSSGDDCVPRVVRFLYSTNWDSKGFHSNLPEATSKAGKERSDHKRLLFRLHVSDEMPAP